MNNRSEQEKAASLVGRVNKIFDHKREREDSSVEGKPEEGKYFVLIKRAPFKSILDRDKQT